MEKKSWLKTVLFFAAQCRVKMVFSVISSIMSVAGGIIPYVSVYQIIILFFEGQQTMQGILL